MNHLQASVESREHDALARSHNVCRQMIGHSSPLGRASLLGSEPELELLPESLLGDETKPEGLKSPVHRGSSVTASAATLFKAVVGAGIFAFPPAMRACGLVLGSCLASIIGMMSLFVTWATIQSVRELRQGGLNAASNGRIEYVEVTQLFSPRANGLITALTVWGQYASVLGFFIFVAETVVPLLPLPRQAVFALIGFAVTPLVLLRKTSHPAFEAAMVFGNVAVALALGTIVFYGLGAMPRAERVPLSELQLVNFDGLGLMFGVSLLMFSCHLEAVSIEQDMADRESFDAMLQWSFIVLAFLFLGTFTLASLLALSSQPIRFLCWLKLHLVSLQALVSPSTLRLVTRRAACRRLMAAAGSRRL